jgi:hypothetical protein
MQRHVDSPRLSRCDEKKIGSAYVLRAFTRTRPNTGFKADFWGFC